MIEITPKRVAAVLRELLIDTIPTWDTLDDGYYGTYINDPEVSGLIGDESNEFALECITEALQMVKSVEANQ